MSLKKLSVGSSAEIVGSSDVITEILIRLSLKKLIQFKLISKQWLSYITSSGFDRLRDSHQILTSVRNFAVCTDFASIRYVDFFQIPNNSESKVSTWKTIRLYAGTRILHSCNGLLLCSTFRLNDYSYKYHVFNTETNEFSVICEPDGVNEILGVSLAFDPSKSPHYQLVCFMRPELSKVDYIYIYSSQTRVWRLSGKCCRECVHYEDGVYWNGAIHWIDRVCKKFLCYDIQNHVFKKMPETLPNHMFDFCHLGKSRDHVNLFTMHGPEFQLYVYQMNKDYTCWYIKHDVRLSYMYDAYAEMIKTEPGDYPFRVLSVVHGEKDEDTFLVLGTPEKAVRCNIYSPLINKTRYKVIR